MTAGSDPRVKPQRSLNLNLAATTAIMVAVVAWLGTQGAWALCLAPLFVPLALWAATEVEECRTARLPRNAEQSVSHSRVQRDLADVVVAHPLIVSERTNLATWEEAFVESVGSCMHRRCSPVRWLSRREGEYQRGTTHPGCRRIPGARPVRRRLGRRYFGAGQPV